MERKGDPVLVGDLLDRFWKANTKAEEAAKFRGRKDIFIGTDGKARCRRCGEPVMFYFAETNRWLPCACKCKSETEEDELAERMAYFKSRSGIEGRYAEADFEKFEETEENRDAFQSCLKYALNYEKIEKKGYGIYLHGTCGTGKTYLAACIGNLLLNAGKEVVLANVNTILTEIRYSYSQRGSERGIVERYMTAGLMIFDDIGTEKYAKANESLSFAQDKFFQIIDGRYVRRKPTIFTSNYTLEQLVNERGMMVKTVDRIAEMSTRKFEVKGRPHRLERITDKDCPF